MRYLPLLPFAIASAAHLTTLVVQDPTGSTVSKLALMPMLVLAVLVSLGFRLTATMTLLVLALLLSWAGDALLQAPGDLGFLLGLGCFLLAHLLYLVLFLRLRRGRRIPWAALLLVLWWVGLVVFLAPHIGGLLLPVAAYGLVLAASSAAGLAANRVVAAGVLAFLASDTLLAFKLFLPGWDFYPMDVLIMALYITAQGLIVVGVLRRARATGEYSDPIAQLS